MNGFKEVYSNKILKTNEDVIDFIDKTSIKYGFVIITSDRKLYCPEQCVFLKTHEPCEICSDNNFLFYRTHTKITSAVMADNYITNFCPNCGRKL